MSNRIGIEVPDFSSRVPPYLIDVWPRIEEAAEKEGLSIDDFLGQFNNPRDVYDRVMED
jgi:hypothetical protein